MNKIKLSKIACVINATLNYTLKKEEDRDIGLKAINPWKELSGGQLLGPFLWK